MSHYDPNATFAAMAGSFALFGVFALVAVAFTIVLQWRIAVKAGYPGALSLLLLIPFVNFVMIILFAFTEWPIERALRAAGGDSSYGPPGGGSYVPPGGGGYAPTSGGGYAPPSTVVPPLPYAPDPKPYGVPPPPPALPPEQL